MFKKLLIGALISILLLAGCVGMVKKPTCSVPKGAMVLRGFENGRLIRVELNIDLDNLEILESIPAGVAANLTKAYPGDWSDSKLTKYTTHDLEELMIIVRTEHLWNCVIRP